MEATGKAKNTYETELNEWISHEKAALDLNNIIGKLWFERSIELILFRNQLVDRSASEIINLHHYAKSFVGKPISIVDSLKLAEEISKMDICPSRVDIGKLGFEWQQAKMPPVGDFLKKQLQELLEKRPSIQPKDVVLFGFGRIGRLAARELIAQAGKGEQLRLKAIVTRSDNEKDIIKRADLLRTDSV